MHLRKLTLILLASIFAGCSAGLDSVEQTNTEIGNFDIPSEENIAQAEAEIKRDFGDLENQIIPFSMEVLSKYNHLDPQKIIPRKLLENAVLYFDRNQNGFKNKNYITLVDYSMRSNLARFFIVNMRTGAVRTHRTTHGIGGDSTHDGFVERLSNIPESKMSTRGFFRVAEIYYGKYGRSIRLDGLSSTNSKARPRAIVIHGGDYVVEANKIAGRSWGCFVLNWSVKDSAVDLIHGGSLLYAEKSLEL